MKLYIMRHGQTDWNKDRRFQGRTDIPLNEYGERLAVESAEGMKNIKFDIIYSSPLKRAYRTAEIVRGDSDVPIRLDDRLIEMGFGVNEGVPAEKLKDEIDAFFNRPSEYVPPKDGESFQQVKDRAGEFIEDVIVPLSKEMPDANVLITAHGALIKGLMLYLNDIDVSKFWDGPFQVNCCVNIFDVNGHDFKMLEEVKVYYDTSGASDDGWTKFAGIGG